MGIQITASEGVGRVLIDGEVVVSTVADIKTGLQEALRQYRETEVDLGGVEEMDTAGLQLMLAAKRCADSEVRLVNHSAAVLRMLELANLGQQLGDPLLIRSVDAA